jgi:ectoine hydroxylase
MHRATRAESDQYAEDGFFYRERVFSDVEIEDLRQAAEHVHKQILDAAESDEAPPIDRVDNQRYQMLRGSTVKWEWRDDLRAVRSMEPAHHLDPRFDALIDDPRIWGPCRAIVGCEELSLFSDKLNVKRPGGAPFPWHQEGPYWAHGAEQLESIVSVLIYLDDASIENGCLWVIPGSHKHGALEGLKNRGVLGALYTDVDLVEGEAFATALPAGSVLWFHRDIVHGSQSNRSDSNRRVFVLAYQPAGLHRWRMDKKRPVRTA